MYCSFTYGKEDELRGEKLELGKSYSPEFSSGDRVFSLAEEASHDEQQPENAHDQAWPSVESILFTSTGQRCELVWKLTSGRSVSKLQFLLKVHTMFWHMCMGFSFAYGACCDGSAMDVSCFFFRSAGDDGTAAVTLVCEAGCIARFCLKATHCACACGGRRQLRLSVSDVPTWRPCSWMPLHVMLQICTFTRLGHTHSRACTTTTVWPAI